jgi:hypothetical protein
MRFLRQGVIEWGTVDWEVNPDDAILGKPILAPKGGEPNPTGDYPGVRVVSLPQYPKEIRNIPASICPTDDVAWTRIKTEGAIEHVWIVPKSGDPRNGAFDFSATNTGVQVEVQARDFEGDSDVDNRFSNAALARFIAEPGAETDSDVRWAPDPLRILGYLAPDLLPGMFDYDAQRLQLAVTDVLDKWEPVAATPSGMLAGATFVLPKGGKFYVDVQLRRRVHPVPPP